MQRKLVYMLLGIVVIVAGSLAMRSYNNMSGGPATGPTNAPAPVKVQIGGPFSLVDHNGKTVTEADYKGRMMMVFFGYTYCPDVCPTALQGISETLDILGDAAAGIAPLFISVDPKRDTVEVLNEYVENFHPMIIGLTGSAKQISLVAKAYRTYYSIGTAEEGDPDSYSVSHSGYIYLMNSDGEYLDAFGHQTDPETMAARIREFM